MMHPQSKEKLRMDSIQSPWWRLVTMSNCW